VNAMPIDDISPSIPVPVRTGVKVEVVTERDRRTMNNMDPETKAVHIRLEQWGAETREKHTGWPPVTMLGRLMKQGPMGASQTGNPPTALSPQAANVDGCVAKLCQIDQRAIKLYYQGWIAREALAKQLCMRERQAQNVLRRARWRIAAHLAVMED
jgi:hypothetical protein